MDFFQGGAQFSNLHLSAEWYKRNSRDIYPYMNSYIEGWTLER